MMKSFLKVDRLTKAFGGVLAVNDVSFAVEPGEIVAIIGPNGAGKTTLFNLITGVIPLTSGTYYFKGRPMIGLPSHQVASLGIARTFQNLELFGEMTVLENVMVGSHYRGRAGILKALVGAPSARSEELEIRSKAMDTLELVGLQGRSHDRAAELPFGQQRLLEVARALAMDPELLLLDEPVAGLNAAEAAGLAQLICRLRDGGLTMIFVEHDMETVMGIADRVIVLDYGVKIAEGSPQEIQNNPRVIAAYLGEEVL